jgi:hypothetical protein
MTIAVSVDLIYQVCGHCGVTYGIPKSMDDEKNRSGGNWFCPNGHSRVYRQTREQKLQEELATEMRQRAEAEQKQRDAEARLLKVEKRISKGVCPCCKRTFVNVQRHMHTKHPEMGTVVGK